MPSERQANEGPLCSWCRMNVLQLAVCRTPKSVVLFQENCWCARSQEKLKCLAVHSDLPLALYTCVNVSHLERELICYQHWNCGLVTFLPPPLSFFSSCSCQTFIYCFSHWRQILFFFKLLFPLSGAGNQRRKDTVAGKIAVATMGWLQSTVLGDFIIWWARETKMKEQKQKSTI